MTGWLQRRWGRLAAGVRAAGLLAAAKRTVYSGMAAVGLVAAALQVAGDDTSGWDILLLSGLIGAPIGLFGLSLPGSIRREYLQSAVTIEAGDLFQFPSHKVVAVNELFDSELGQRVARNSLHGSVIVELFGGDGSQFEKQIHDSLNERKIAPDEISSRHNDRYPIGTTAVLDFPPSKLFLVALTHTNTSDGSWKASADPIDMLVALNELWRTVRVYSNGEPVAVPLLGSGQAQVPLAHHQLVEVILQSFDVATREQEVTKELHIVLTESDFLKVAPRIRS